MASPEHLSDYIKVSRISVWLVLAIVFSLLASTLIWSMFGSLPTTLVIQAYVENGMATGYVDSETAVRLKAGMAVQISGMTGFVASIASQPKSAAELQQLYSSDYLQATLQAGPWNYAVAVPAAGVPDGIYPMKVILGNIAPISFLIN